MEHEQMSYPEALRWLAKKYHIEIEEKEPTNEERRKQSTRESLFIVNEFARTYFQQSLNIHEEGSIGKSYFRHRGISEDIVRKFQLGYCPSSGIALSREAERKGYRKEFLIQAGLCYEKDDRSIRDRFYGRVIFPWFNISGRVVGFGGRVLDSRTKGVIQKYVNSPESDIYSKRKELYGLYQAKQAIAKFDHVYMVEGYTDVIAMHQCGLENVVANSGTALSDTQIRTLHRLTSNITLLYDGDEAGIKASMRGIDMLLSEGMNVKVLLLPDGDDPDSFARKHTYEELRRYIDTHEQNFIHFKTNLLLKDVDNDPIKRAALITDIAHSIGLVPNEILRYAYLKECASLLDTDEQIVLNEIKKVVSSRQEKQLEKHRQEKAVPIGGQPESSSSLAPEKTPMQEKEMEIARILVRHGEKKVCTVKDDEGNDYDVSVAEYIYYDMKQDELRFQDHILLSMLSEAMNRIGQDGYSAERYFTSHPDPSISSLAVELASDQFQLSRSNERDHVSEERRLKEIVPLLMMEYKTHLLKEEMKEVMQELSLPATSQDTTRTLELMKRYKELTDISKEFARRMGERVLN